MGKTIKTLGADYENLLFQISDTYSSGRQKAVMAVNSSMVETYWKIGQYIVEFEQGGNVKAKYGTALLENLSSDLSRSHGKGFSRSNLNYMRLFYQFYPNCETLSHKLTWSNICELVKINDPLERSFYENQSQIKYGFIGHQKRKNQRQNPTMPPLRGFSTFLYIVL
jgi:hypothetical protein